MWLPMYQAGGMQAAREAVMLLQWRRRGLGLSLGEGLGLELAASMEKKLLRRTESKGDEALGKRGRQPWDSR
jgi:hypothetical protein